MPESIVGSPPPPAALPRRGQPVIAWAVIFLIVGFETIWPMLPSNKEPQRTSRGVQATEELQARYMVGMAQILPQKTLYLEVKKNLNTGPVSQRLQFIALAGELAGSQEALAQIRLLREMAEQQGVAISDEDGKLLAILERLYQDYEDKRWNSPSVEDEERTQLEEKLGWAGKLALVPNQDLENPLRSIVIDQAKRLALSILVAFMVLLGLAFLGGLGLLVWIACLIGGALKESLPAPRGHGALYVEGFAVYMVVFLALGLIRALLLPRGPTLLLAAGGMLLALAAGLLWPVLRGAPWSEVRADLGWNLGRRPWLEGVVGLSGYLLVIPTFALGLIVTSILLSMQRHFLLGESPERSFSTLPQPSHPIVEWVGDASLLKVLQILLVAVILAPLVEEAMFRGALYRHLREATASWGRTWSFLLSAILVSFIFAIIHPQGILAVPVLMGLAFGLTVLREWRGSLIPSMMVHGIHNGMATFLLFQGLGKGQ